MLENARRALGDHGALELGEHAHHLEHGAARRRRGVKPLLVQVKLDVAGVDLAQEGHEILQRAAEPIDGPGHDDVEPAPSRVAAQTVERRPLVPALGAGNAIVCIDFHHFVAEALGHRPELPLLVIGGLVEGRRTHVKGGSHEDCHKALILLG
jgi:hypothetical protein